LTPYGARSNELFRKTCAAGSHRVAFSQENVLTKPSQGTRRYGYENGDWT
jgi:hypothetical protein